MRCPSFAVFVGLLPALILSTSRPARAGEPVLGLTAERMTAENVSRLQQKGLDSWGGLGDWCLSNGTIRAIVSNVDHESDLSSKGGVLIDLGFVGREDDQFVSAQDLIAGSRKTPVEYDRIIPAVGKDSASLTAFGEDDGVIIETRYTVNTQAPDRLFVSKRIHRRDKAARDFGVYTPLTFNYHSMETFLLSTQDPSESNGFHQEEFSTRGPSAFSSAARNVDTIVMIGNDDSILPVAYGWRLLSAKKIKEGKMTELPHFALSDWGASAFLLLNQNFLIGSRDHLGLLQLLQVPAMDLDLGEALLIEEEFLVGDRSDVACITDQLYSKAPLSTGHVTGDGAVVHVDRGDRVPFTFCRPDANGSFSFRAPEGSYILRIIAPSGLAEEHKVKVAAGGGDLGNFDAGTPARVALPRDEPMRLVFRGTNGTPDPDFEDALTGFTVHDDEGIHTQEGIPTIFLAGIGSDRASVAIRPGSYRVYATRGIEYSIETADITVESSKTTQLNIAIPHRVVETPGFIAADLHVHSGPSMDTPFSTVERVRTFVAEHGEVMVASEHETLFDYAPLIRKMGVQDRIVSVLGTEMTSEVPTVRAPHTIGHANFFPLIDHPEQFKHGVPANENRRMREVLNEVHQHYPDAVTQLNHARESSRLQGDVGGGYEKLINNQSYFDHMGPAAYPYNPLKSIDSFPNNTLIERDPVSGVRDIDFDAMEIMNGKRSYAPTRVQALRNDWTSLLLQGIRLTGTANSDSHNKTQQVALPRNMIAVPDDRIAGFDEKAFTKSIREGNLYGTTGPLIELDLSGAKMGDTYRGVKGTLDLHVMHAPWVNADTLRVLVNGKTVKEVAVPGDGHFSMDMDFDHDSFVLIEVEGKPGADYAEVYPGFDPYAFSNPIFVDSDGDGKWTPPGLGALKN